MRANLPEPRLRIGLGVFAAAWALVAVANTFVSDTHRWAPRGIAVLAACSAVCTGALAIRPSLVFPYRVGGTCAIGTMLFRSASIALGFFLARDPDALWVTIPSLSLTVILGSLYWQWWLDDVKIWHEQHKHGERP